jgi:hypothetical protein
MKDLKLHFFVHLILVQIYCHTKKADSGSPLDGIYHTVARWDREKTFISLFPVALSPASVRATLIVEF